MAIDNNDMNRDPITGEPGSHPVGTAAGGVGGAAVGAAVGSIAGPLGALIGGAIGAAVGGSAGHNVAEGINPTDEDTYWRDSHNTTAYYNKDYTYDKDYQPAYAVGYANRARYDANTRFEDVESDLERSWNEVKGESKMLWADARNAARDAWYRITPM